jgi:hypothetical protein
MASLLALLLAACGGSGPAGTAGGASGTSASGVAATPAAESPYKPTATFQEVMDSAVDPSADYIWNAVSTTVDKSGIHERKPVTDEDWHQLRRRAVLLAESANLIAVPGRKAANNTKTLEEGIALDPEPIQKRLDANHAQLVGFAEALRQIAIKLVEAADHKDPVAVTEAGGTLDEVCEDCHKVFWYPDDATPKAAAKK